MAPQQHRFSRRFLTMLIFITCVAIVLLSKMDEAEEPHPSAPASSSQQHSSQP